MGPEVTFLSVKPHARKKRLTDERPTSRVSDARLDARVRRAAFTLLEASNPKLRRDGELFMEIIRFIWDANPSYDVYREFSKRHTAAVPLPAKQVAALLEPFGAH